MIYLQPLSAAHSPGLRDRIPLLRLQPHPDWWLEDMGAQVGFPILFAVRIMEKGHYIEKNQNIPVL